jgi:hypothetical protein
MGSFVGENYNVKKLTDIRCQEIQKAHLAHGKGSLKSSLTYIFFALNPQLS